MKYENRWKPKLTDQYYYIDECTSVKNTIYTEEEKDKNRIRCGNCFQYIRDAHNIQSAYRKLLKSFHMGE